MKLIHQYALSPLSIDEIFAKIPISRRYLEMKFRRKLNKSPLDEILRVRLERAKQLLTKTDQTLAQIAQAAGFHNNVRLSLVFKQKEAMTPENSAAAREWQRDICLT
jgi:LacI family transcriptional regulator